MSVSSNKWALILGAVIIGIALVANPWLNQLSDRGVKVYAELQAQIETETQLRALSAEQRQELHAALQVLLKEIGRPWYINILSGRAKRAIALYRLLGMCLVGDREITPAEYEVWMRHFRERSQPGSRLDDWTVQRINVEWRRMLEQAQSEHAAGSETIKTR